MNQEDPRIEHAKITVNTIIGADTFLDLRKRTKEDEEREKFIKLITQLEQAYTRSVLLDKDFSINLVKYDEEFYEMIDSLLLLHYGKTATDFILFYVYDRINDDGTMNYLQDSNGTAVAINNPSQLWDVINLVRNPSPKPRARTQDKTPAREKKKR